MRKAEIVNRIRFLEQSSLRDSEQRIGILDTLLDMTHVIKWVDGIVSNRLDALEKKVFGKKPRPTK